MNTNGIENFKVNTITRSCEGIIVVKWKHNIVLNVVTTENWSGGFVSAVLSTSDQTCRAGLIFKDTRTVKQTDGKTKN